MRIFIGASAKNQIEAKVLMSSISKHSGLTSEFYFIDGQTGVAASADGFSVFSLDQTCRMSGYTDFSLARFAIPEWCGFRGRAIYMDSDMLAFASLAPVWNRNLGDAGCACVSVRDVLCPPYYEDIFLNRLKHSPGEYYLTSMMLMDCARLKFWNVRNIAEMIQSGEVAYDDVLWLGEPFRNKIPLKVTPLLAEYNHLDVINQHTKVLHFTEIATQPWLYGRHPFGGTWDHYFIEAVERQAITKAEIEKAFEKKFISERVLQLLPGAWV